MLIERGGGLRRQGEGICGIAHPPPQAGVRELAPLTALSSLLSLVPRAAPTDAGWIIFDRKSVLRCRRST